MTDLRTQTNDRGLTIRDEMLLLALKNQVKYNMLLTNPRYTGYSSFAKAILASILKDDTKAPKTAKKLYEYLSQKGYYETKRDRV